MDILLNRFFKEIPNEYFIESIKKKKLLMNILLNLFFLKLLMDILLNRFKKNLLMDILLNRFFKKNT